jgi:uncharacterized membrane protein YGL010W
MFKWKKWKISYDLQNIAAILPLPNSSCSCSSLTSLLLQLFYTNLTPPAAVFLTAFLLQLFYINLTPPAAVFLTSLLLQLFYINLTPLEAASLTSLLLQLFYTTLLHLAPPAAVLH